MFDARWKQPCRVDAGLDQSRPSVLKLEQHRRALAHGVRSTLEIVPDMIHVWHWFAPILREGREAIARMGAFIGALAY